MYSFHILLIDNCYSVMLLYNSELIFYGGHSMNEKNTTSRFRALVGIARKKFTELNIHSKLILKIGATVFLAFLLLALYISISFTAGLSYFGGQIKIIEWIVIYSFRFWIMLVFGSLILDILIKR